MVFVEVRIWGGDDLYFWSFDKIYRIPYGYMFLDSSTKYAAKMIKRLTMERGVPLFLKVANEWRYPTVKGYYAPEDLVEKVREREVAIANRREEARRKRQDIYIGKVTNRLQTMYPMIPHDDLENVLKAFGVCSGRVGRASNIPLDVRIRKAVVAYLRHEYTNYDNQLDRAREKALDRWEFQDYDSHEDRVYKQNMYGVEVNKARGLIRDDIQIQIEEILGEWSDVSENAQGAVLEGAGGDI